jgi:aspartate aminotransferase-like enzyme
MVEPRVYEAMSQPIVGHLDPFFFSVIEDIRAGLREVFGTQNDFTFAISGTGSAGMEAAVANFVEPGMKMAVFANGFFCDRLSEMGRRHRADVVRFEKPWGETFTEAEAQGIHTTGAAAHRRVRAGGDLDGRLHTRESHLQCRTRGGRSGNCGYGDIAWGNAG